MGKFFFVKQKTAYEIGLGIPAEPLFRSISVTPSQLYVFMPPNLGGFFMVRSYYPSECHADYFDFERIEALKPAIERSEERRVGKECRSRWSTCDYKNIDMTLSRNYTI